jgi:hypothetical protein
MHPFRHKKRFVTGGIVPPAAQQYANALDWAKPTRVICTHDLGVCGLFDVFTRNGSRRSAELCAGLHATLLLHAAAHEEG